MRVPLMQTLMVSFRAEDLRDRETVIVLERELAVLAELLDVQRLVVSFEGVRAIPTAVLGLCLQLVVDARQRGIQVRLASMTPSIRDSFEMLSTARMVRIFCDEEEAIFTPWPA
jgi:anti-anti-sigma regulatory factor